MSISHKENQIITSWKSPSNLALVKYWGKYGRQYPRNPSISFTLNNAHTITSLKASLKEKNSKTIDLQFKYDGKTKPSFEARIKKFFESIGDRLPFIWSYQYEIESVNSFPHSSGIASSASAMSALSLCLMSVNESVSGKMNEDKFLREASLISRLGSGSACRSVYPKMALWGQHDSISNSSNDFAIPYYEEFDPVFESFHDDILIVFKLEVNGLAILFF